MFFFKSEILKIFGCPAVTPEPKFQNSKSQQILKAEIANYKSRPKSIWYETFHKIKKNGIRSFNVI
jgi:hypothetical protein